MENLLTRRVKKIETPKESERHIAERETKILAEFLSVAYLFASFVYKPRSDKDTDIEVNNLADLSPAAKTMRTSSPVRKLCIYKTSLRKAVYSMTVVCGRASINPSMSEILFCMSLTLSYKSMMLSVIL